MGRSEYASSDLRVLVCAITASLSFHVVWFELSFSWGRDLLEGGTAHGDCDSSRRTTAQRWSSELGELKFAVEEADIYLLSSIEAHVR